MNITEVDKKVKEIVKDTMPFFDIAAEQVIVKIHEFCVENDVLPGDEEYDAIMNMGGQHAQFMFGLPLTVEKLKKMTKVLPPSENIED